MPIFVVEVQGDEGFPIEDEVVAAIDAKDVDQARDFLGPAVQATNRKLFEARAKRWSEGCATHYREASPREAVAWEQRKATHRDPENPAVVWLIDL